MVITEQQKYMSGILRNIGFALFAPPGSIVFQWIVLKKSLFLGNSRYAMIAFILAWLFIASGYVILQEKK